jgi:cytochrome c-type biogenesis protein CcmH/NrfG
MAQVALRVYNHEIEEMIEKGQSAQAIAHCRHILKFYPKHIDTYRLLGKAYLESRRFTEASDVLQRVLSSVPDDFISQIGMSIIREDEGNLDAAIWHMERAFESQPANSAVQDELRGLYARRDGVEPPRIRLTRGALVRMYARGDLYQQAIAEIRAALTEDPQRVDLEVILARMYFLAGQIVAATEVCSRLVAKLPYCFEANRILSEVLPGTSRAEDAPAYLQRVHDMDPYLAFNTDPGGRSLDVADNAVNIELLEYSAEVEAPQTPEWTQNAGVNWEEESDSLPDWFDQLNSPEAADESPAQADKDQEPTAVIDAPNASAYSEEETPLIPDQTAEDSDVIPDWMESAGWAASEQVNPDSEKGFNLPEDDLQTGEVPEWLKSIAPQEDADDKNPGKTDWLKNILPDEAPQIVENDAAEQTLEQIPSDEVEAPVETILSEEDNSLTSQPATPPTELSADELPDWIKESGFLEDSADIPDMQAEEISSDAEILTSDQTPENPLDALEAEEIPGWLKSLEANQDQPNDNDAELAPVDSLQTAEQIETSEINEFEAEAAVIDQEAALADDDQIAGDEAPDETPDLAASPDMDDAMAWLESLAAKNGADEDTLLIKPEDRTDQRPDWIPSADENSIASQPTPTENLLDESIINPVPNPETTKNEESSPEAPDSLISSDQDLESLFSENNAAQAGEIAKLDFNFEDFEIEEEKDDQTGNANFFQEIEDNLIPDEDSSIKTSETIPPAFSRPQPPFGKAISPISVDGDDEAFAWLESLASEHGASEDTLFTPEDDRNGPPPAWALDQSPNADLDQSISAPDTSEEIAKSASTFDQASEPDRSLEDTAPIHLPDWLSEEDKPDDLGAELSIGSEPEMPAWLKDMEDGTASSIVSEDAALDANRTKGLSPQEVDAETDNDLPSAVGPFVNMNEAPEMDETPPTWLSSLEQDERSPAEAIDGSAPWFATHKEEETPVTEAEIHSEWKPEFKDEKLETTPAAETAASQDEMAILKNARSALEAYNIERALEGYNKLIQNGQYLEDAIHDLRDALYRYPIDISIWQALGDAYMRSNRLQEALDAYTKAEELLR